MRSLELRNPPHRTYLRNSPKLESYSLSLDEDRLHFWEFSDIYDNGKDLTAEWGAEDRDFEIKRFFPVLCQEYELTLRDNSDKTEDPRMNLSPTLRLSLKKLDLGTCCLLTVHAHLLTNTANS